jgi:hypothetical protein
MEVMMFVITQNINYKNITNFNEFDILTDEKDNVLIFEEESEAVEFVYSLGMDIDNDVRYSAMGDVNVSRLH